MHHFESAKKVEFLQATVDGKTMKERIEVQLFEKTNVKELLAECGLCRCRWNRSMTKT